MYMENVFACLQNNLTDGEEDLPEDSFSLLSVLLVGSLNFPFDRSRLAPRRQPSGRPFTRKLWSKLARCIPLFPFLLHPVPSLTVFCFFTPFVFSPASISLSRLLFAKMKYHRIVSISSIHESPFCCFCMVKKSVRYHHTFDAPRLSSSRGEWYCSSKHHRFSASPVSSTHSFRISLSGLDILIRGGQHFSLRGNLHGPRFTENRKFIPGLPRYRRPVCRLSGYDICRGEWSSRLLGIWTAILRHLDRFWRYVQHCLYSESLRNLSRSLHTYKGSA